MNKKIETLLIENDFSKDSDREKVYMELKNRINNSRGIKMKNTTRKLKPLIAACLMLVISAGLFSKSTMGKEVYSKVLSVLNLKNVSIMVTDSPDMPYNGPIPEFLKGKLFDKAGNKITEFNENVNDNMYNANGEKIVEIRDEKIYTQEQVDAEQKKEYNIFYDKSEAEENLDFKIITPSELPEGYVIKRWEILKESRKYATLCIENATAKANILIAYRYIDETTSWATDSEKAEEIKINGYDAILADDDMLIMDIDGVNICVMATGDLKKKMDKASYRADIIKIAEELK